MPELSYDIRSQTVFRVRQDSRPKVKPSGRKERPQLMPEPTETRGAHYVDVPDNLPIFGSLHEAAIDELAVNLDKVNFHCIKRAPPNNWRERQAKYNYMIQNHQGIVAFWLRDKSAYLMWPKPQ